MADPKQASLPQELQGAGVSGSFAPKRARRHAAGSQPSKIIAMSGLRLSATDSSRPQHPINARLRVDGENTLAGSPRRREVRNPPNRD